MYRKVAFLLVSIFRFDLQIKSTLLLLFSWFSAYTMKTNSPFVSKELNMLELSSNLTALIILYSGTLYSNNIGVYFQVILFINIMMFNSRFCISCFFSLIKIFFNTFIIKIQRFFPRLTANYVAMLKTNKSFRKTSMSLIEYIKQFRTNFRKEIERFREK